jgi:mannose-6-phosphate isomerase-like protein (cupin superfamily)
VKGAKVPDYTKKNLKTEVENSAEKFGHAPALEAHFANESLAMRTAGMAYERVAPNERAPFGHRHREQEEVYVFIEGSGRIKLDDDIIDVGELDAVRIGPGVMRCVEGGPEGIGYIAFGAPPVEDKQAEAELAHGWWTD